MLSHRIASHHSECECECRYYTVTARREGEGV
jgi:hypothetical protein